MQDDSSTDSPRYRSTPTRRHALALLAGAAATGLSGCLGGDDVDAEAQAATGDDTTAPGGPGQDATTAAATTTTTPTLELTPAEGFDCTTLGMPSERYDAADSPFVFSFAYPEGWLLERLEPLSTVGVVVHAPVAVETGGFLYDVTVEQSTRASSAAYFDETWDDDWEEVGTLSFRGEERRIVEMPSGDPGRVILRAVLPDAAGEYWYAGVDCQNLSFREECFPTFRAIGEAVIESFQPR